MIMTKKFHGYSGLLFAYVTALKNKMTVSSFSTALVSIYLQTMPYSPFGTHDWFGNLQTIWFDIYTDFLNQSMIDIFSNEASQ